MKLWIIPRTCKLDLMLYCLTPGTQEVEAEGSKFKVMLGYTVNSRIFWDVGDPICLKRKCLSVCVFVYLDVYERRGREGEREKRER